MFPEMKAAMKARQKRNTVQAEANSTNSYDKEGKVLVGFGPYNHMTRQALLESVQDEHRKYIRELLHHPNFSSWWQARSAPVLPEKKTGARKSR